MKFLWFSRLRGWISDPLNKVAGGLLVQSSLKAPADSSASLTC